eukprot:CAMPEP_0202907146 /NCGR_PEP_ID=MMETSP1392-20130828/41502_1 /ASSEMBLY_ACC=CAM_ASM_000868 /TAXON_ID=225041 /ORGANISM="Chlamydomonas chlamydogama, Strain SAG 11-48b" /LENGTH=210 /DNA_ID=CAMNT_0049595925 /DNA_START=198 /DNA_END=833 /DNA_ORIENTATION=+
MGPVARDDDGTVIAAQPMGPPPLFPETELPEHPELTAKDTLLLLRRNDMVNSAKTSPFFIELPKPVKEGPDAPVDSYSLQSSKKPKRQQQPLSSVMTLIPDYFPEELFSEKDKRASKKAQDAFWRAQGKRAEAGGLHRLDQLAQMEKAAGEGGARGGGGEDEGPPEEEVPVDEDEEEDMEYDDYYQGEHFDDDEGYDDGYDDGGDEGPVY